MQFEKYFTPAEANKTLPLAIRIVRDILDTSHQIRTLMTVLEGENENHPQIEGLLDDLKSYFAELEEMGCYYKDWNFSIGLVDFPAFIDNKEVFLCWRSDESSIRYYHEIEAGYAGRKPIPKDYLR
jgi:hypothetical protein